MKKEKTSNNKTDETVYKKLTVSRSSVNYPYYSLYIELDIKYIILNFCGELLLSYKIDDTETLIDHLNNNDYYLTDKELTLFNNLHCFNEPTIKFFILNYLTRTNIIIL